jgi:hypothetical protein
MYSPHSLISNTSLNIQENRIDESILRIVFLCLVFHFILIYFKHAENQFLKINTLFFYKTTLNIQNDLQIRVNLKILEKFFILNDAKSRDV